jgi:hypothetical protein
MEQVFHFVPKHLALAQTNNPHAPYECGCVGCSEMTNIVSGTLVEFHDNTSWQYRLFCTPVHALECIPTNLMSQA